MVENLMKVLQDIVTGFGDVFGTSLNSIVSIFIDTSGDTEKLTMFGILSLIGLAFGLFRMLFKWVNNLIHMRG